MILYASARTSVWFACCLVEHWFRTRTSRTVPGVWLYRAWLPGRLPFSFPASTCVFPPAGPPRPVGTWFHSHHPGGIPRPSHPTCVSARTCPVGCRAFVSLVTGSGRGCAPAARATTYHPVNFAIPRRPSTLHTLPFAFELPFLVSVC